MHHHHTISSILALGLIGVGVGVCLAGLATALWFLTNDPTDYPDDDLGT